MLQLKQDLKRNTQLILIKTPRMVIFYKFNINEFKPKPYTNT